MPGPGPQQGPWGAQLPRSLPTTPQPACGAPASTQSLSWEARVQVTSQRRAWASPPFPHVAGKSHKLSSARLWSFSQSAAPRSEFGLPTAPPSSTGPSQLLVLPCLPPGFAATVGHLSLTLPQSPTLSNKMRHGEGFWGLTASVRKESETRAHPGFPSALPLASFFFLYRFFFFVINAPTFYSICSMRFLIFLYKFIYLFIFWLCWVFIAARGLSLVAACRLLITVASLVVEHGL